MSYMHFIDYDELVNNTAVVFYRLAKFLQLPAAPSNTTLGHVDHKGIDTRSQRGSQTLSTELRKGLASTYARQMSELRELTKLPLKWDLSKMD
eukprot:scaffold50_cov420-Prasinococcus_capsulatus_cf.AAC.14